MLQEPAVNKLGLKIYYGLWEIFIGVGSFMIFFGVFIKYYFHSLEESMLSGYVKSSMSFYKPLINFLNQFGIFSSFIDKHLNMNDFNKNLELEEENVKKHNAEYDNLLIKLIAYILGGFLVVLFIPILLGLISFQEINWIYIGISFLLHIILITIFEYALLYIIIPINNPIELHGLFDNLNI